MNKPDGSVFERFRIRFEALQQGKAKRQYLVPYFMSGHPGCTVNDMVELAEYIRDHGLYTEQVQDFTPTPMSVSTCMYYTGLNPFTLEPVHVPKGREKKIQRAILQYREPQNRGLVLDGLRMAGREDLVGSGKKCLISGDKYFGQPRPGPVVRQKVSGLSRAADSGRSRIRERPGPQDRP